jgi:hypothetical protein
VDFPTCELTRRAWQDIPMQATVYANLTTRRLTTTLGGSAVSFPAFVQGDKVRIGVRFAESIEGSPIEVQRIVTHIRASIGFVDVRPTTGFFVRKRSTEPHYPATTIWA